MVVLNIRLSCVSSLNRQEAIFQTSGVFLWSDLNKLTLNKQISPFMNETENVNLTDKLDLTELILLQNY